MARYGWVITKDHIFDPEYATKDRVGVYGPRGISEKDVAVLRAGKGRRWRALDDEDEVYYEGRYIGPDELMFRPLDDFAMPDAGATTIQYWQSGEGGGWKTL
jgi:hypothetical protein